MMVRTTRRNSDSGTMRKATTTEEGNHVTICGEKKNLPFPQRFTFWKDNYENFDLFYAYLCVCV